MTNNCNKLPSIHKKVFKLKFIFCAIYILLSAKTLCAPLNKSATVKEYDQLVQLKKNQPLKKSVLNEQPTLKKINGSKKEVSTFTSLLGEATILQLGDYSFGMFRSWPSQELFILKLSLNVEGGWIALLNINQESARVRIDYDRAPDGRIIKIDSLFFKLLCSELRQSPDWHDVLFCYKQPLSDQPIFTDDGLTSATPFERKIYKKTSAPSFKDSNLSLVSSEISIKGRVAPDKLKNLDQIGFILLKDGNYLGKLVKNMLETDLQLADIALQPNKVLDHPQDHMMCPATLVDDTLTFNSQNLGIYGENGDAGFCLEESVPLYCYLKDKSYYRLIELKNVKELIKTDDQLPNPTCYYNPTTYYTVVPPKEPLAQEPTLVPSTRVSMADDLQDKSVVVEEHGVPLCEDKVFELPIQDGENHFNTIIASEESLLYLNLLATKDTELAKLQAEKQKDHEIGEIDYEYESRLADLCLQYKTKDYIQTLFSQYLFEQLEKKNKALAFFEQKHKQTSPLQYDSDKKALLVASEFQEQHEKRLDSLENSMNHFHEMITQSNKMLEGEFNKLANELDEEFAKAEALMDEMDEDTMS